MPVFTTKMPKFKPGKTLEEEWDNFRGGLNTLLKDTEIDKDELADAENLMLVGKGAPTKRWGTDTYFMANTTGAVRGLGGFYQKDGTNQLLSITDKGYLSKKSNASYSMITGASWASGNDVTMSQLGNKMYIVNGQREMVRYSNPTLVGFPTIAKPSGLFATQSSGVSGTNTWSYRVSSVSNVGETEAATAVQADNCPQDLADGSVKVTWSAVSTASGILQGYNIYGRKTGDERYMAQVDSDSTAYIDDGSAYPAELTYPPTADSTGGINAEFVTRFEDRLIFAGIDGEPSEVIISGRWPYQEQTDWSYGGCSIKVEPDAGDDITGLGVYGHRIIVFKEHSIWEIVLTTESVGNYTVTIPSTKLITKSHGCISHKSIVAVENDVFFLSRNGVYALGYEPNIAIDVLRTNEISARIRPYFENLTYSQLQKASASYYNYKYILSFPGRDETMVYDRERLAWMGPWTTDATIYDVYKDSNGDMHLIYGEDDKPYVTEYSDDYMSDGGTAIPTRLRTKKGSFGDWVSFKNIKEVFTLFRNVKGSINVDIRMQQRDGSITTEKSFNIETESSNAGWGADMWGSTQWADSESTGGAIDINEVYRYAILNKAARNVQLDISTSGKRDDYELLRVKSNAKKMGYGFLPASEKV